MDQRWIFREFNFMGFYSVILFNKIDYLDNLF